MSGMVLVADLSPDQKILTREDATLLLEVLNSATVNVRIADLEPLVRLKTKIRFWSLGAVEYIAREFEPKTDADPKTTAQEG